MSLIEKLEKAEGPSREIDVRIALATGWDIRGASEHSFSELADKFGFDWALETATEYNSIYRALPAFSSSIDAALTLLPEGRLWTLDPASNEEWECSLYHEGTRIWHDEDTTSVAATPAIAICIAALRAREGSE